MHSGYGDNTSISAFFIHTKFELQRLYCFSQYGVCKDISMHVCMYVPIGIYGYISLSITRFTCYELELYSYY